MRKSIKLSGEQLKRVKPLLKAAYPEYRGRKVTVSFQTAPMSFLSTWDEGTYSKFVAVELSTLKTIEVPRNGGICEKDEIKEVMIPRGVVVLEEIFFQGQHCGIEIHVNTQEDTLPWCSDYLRVEAN